jgi:chromate transport protein ChrA
MIRSWRSIQIALAYALLQCALWTEGRTQGLFALATAACMVIATLINRRSLRSLGLGVTGFLPSLIAIPIAIAASAIMALLAWKLGTLHGLFGARPPLWHSAAYAVWALVQQFMLNSFFYVNFEELLGDRQRALWAATALFCLAHIPNPVLMAGTLLAALFFVSLFRRYRNIYPLALAHAFLGLSLAVTIPDAWLRHMRVGISYLHFVSK